MTIDTPSLKCHHITQNNCWESQSQVTSKRLKSLLTNEIHKKQNKSLKLTFWVIDTIIKQIGWNGLFKSLLIHEIQNRKQSLHLSSVTRNTSSMMLLTAVTSCALVMPSNERVSLTESAQGDLIQLNTVQYSSIQLNTAQYSSVQST